MMNEQKEKNKFYGIYIFAKILLRILMIIGPPLCALFVSFEINNLNLKISVLVLGILISILFAKKKNKKQDYDVELIFPFFNKLSDYYKNHFSCYDRRIKKEKWERTKVPKGYTERYILTWILFILNGIIYFYTKSINGTFELFYSIFFSAIIIYRLIALLHSQFVIIFRHSNIENDLLIIKTQNARRWILLSCIHFFEIILYFSLIYLILGNKFSPIIRDPLTAFYQSTLTMTTLGYGEIHPCNWASKILVITQQFYFFFFLILVIPRILSSVQVREYENMNRIKSPKSSEDK